MKQVQPKTIQILLAFVILLACGGFKERSLIGTKAPPVTSGRWLTQNPPTKTSLAGRVYIVEFWATWCPPCVEAIPHLITLTTKYEDKGVTFISISEDSSADVDKVQSIIRQKKINYHIALDANPSFFEGISKRFYFNAIPIAFVIDHNGTVVWQGHPLGPGFEAAVAQAVEAAPQPLLKDIELEQFEEFRDRLCSGDFLKIYRRLKTKAEEDTSSDGKAAKKIIEAIDNKIKEKLEQAAELRKTDPVAAFELYEQIVKNHRGIEAVTPAVIAACDELKNSEPVIKEQAAAKAIYNVKSTFIRYKGCSLCSDFNINCEDCLKLNKAKLAGLEKKLAEICGNYPDTKATETARRMREKLAP